MTVRRATADDVEAIREVALLTWPPTYLPFTSPDHVMAGLARWWSRDAVAASVRDDVTFVAEHDGTVVGTATLGTWGDDHVLWKIYVVPSRQGTGTGSALMRAVLDAAPPGRDLLLDVVHGNDRARAFYERLGFTHERDEPGEHGTTTAWMRLRRAA